MVTLFYVSWIKRYCDIKMDTLLYVMPIPGKTTSTLDATWSGYKSMKVIEVSGI